MNACITTKFLGPTRTKGARIKARVHFSSVTVNWDYSMDCWLNHAFAADYLAKTMGWHKLGYTVHAASSPDDSTYAHILVFNSPE